MGDIADKGNLAWRDYVVDSVVSSGKRDPSKAEIRDFVATVDSKFESIEAGNGMGLITFATTSARNVFTHGVGTTGVTAQDLQDGNDYRSNGTAWVLIGVSPAVRLTALEAIDAGTRLTALEGFDAGARLDILEAFDAGTRLTTLETTDTATATRLGTLEGYNAGTRLTALEAFNAGTRLTALEGFDAGARLDILEAFDAGTRLTTLETTDTATATRLGTLEGYNAGTRLTALEAFNAGTRLTALETTDTDLAARLGIVEGYSAGPRLTVLEAAVTAAPSASELASMWSATLTGEPAARAAIASGDIVLSGVDGQVIRVTGAAVRAPRAVYRLLPGHKYEIVAAVRRKTNPTDPVGDAVTLRVAWLGASKTQLALATLDQVNLGTASGLVLLRKVVALAAGDEVDAVAAAGTIYFTPAVQTFGGDGVTDILPLLRVTDLTSNTLVSADVSGLTTRVVAIESLSAGTRLDALESGTAVADLSWFLSVGDAQAATIAGTVDRLVVLGADSGDAVYYARGVSGSFQSADGQWWAPASFSIIGSFSTNMSTGRMSFGPTLSGAGQYWFDFQEVSTDITVGGADHTFHMFMAAALSSPVSAGGELNGFYAHLDGNSSITALKTMQSIWAQRGNATWTPDGTVNQMAGGYMGARITGAGHINFGYGVQAVCGQEATFAGTIGSAYGVNALVYNNGTSALPFARGLSSTVTNSSTGAGITLAYGLDLVVNNAGTGITTYRGINSNVPANLGWFSQYHAGAAPNYLAGALGLGNTSVAAMNLRVSQTITGSTTARSIYTDSVVQPDVTVAARYISTLASVAAGSATITSLTHIHLEQGTIGAGITVTNQHGVLVSASLTGGTNNYAFRSDIPVGTGRFSLFTSTAAIYMAGSTAIGDSVTSASAKFYVEDSALASAALLRSTGASFAGNLLRLTANRARSSAFNLISGETSTGSTGVLRFRGDGLIWNNPGTALVSGGDLGMGVAFGSTSNSGIYTGIGAPTIVAAKDSAYIRFDASTNNDWLYRATDSSGTWVAVQFV